MYTASRTTSRIHFMGLLLAYALIISLFAPLTIKRAQASAETDRGGKENAPTMESANGELSLNLSTQGSGQRSGTAIAGIIAAQGNNASGISGVMWRASLMSLRLLDSTGTGIANAVEAIDYAVAHGAQVIQARERQRNRLRRGENILQRCDDATDDPAPLPH